MRAKTRLAVGLLAALSSLSLPAAAGEPDPAEKLFEQGVADLEAGRLDAACPAIEESYKLEPRPGTLFTLAECEAKRGRIATAVRRYDDYLALYAVLSADKRKKQGDRERDAREQRATLLPLVPELTLTLPPGAPAGTTVTRDGAPVAAAALGVPLQVDPGEHVLRTQTPGGPVSEVRVTLGRSEKKVLLLDAKETAAVPAAPPEQPAPPASGPSGQRVAAFVTGGLGVAGLVLGAITGGLAVAKKGVVDTKCNVGGDPTACTHTGKLAADAMQTFGLVSTIGFGAGIAGLGTGLVLLVTEPSRKGGAPSASLGLRGTW